MSLWAKLLRLNQILKQSFFLLVLKAGSRKSLDKIWKPLLKNGIKCLRPADYHQYVYREHKNTHNLSIIIHLLFSLKTKLHIWSGTFLSVLSWTRMQCTVSSRMHCRQPSPARLLVLSGARTAARQGYLQCWQHMCCVFAHSDGLVFQQLKVLILYSLRTSSSNLL